MTLGAAVLVWSASDGLAWPARMLIVVLLAVLPTLSVAQAESVGIEVADLPRLPVYLSSAAALWFLGLLAFGAGVTSGFDLATLGLVRLPAASLTAWTLTALLGTLVLAALWRMLGVRESAVLLQLLPRTPVERVVFVGLSLSAGVAEELVFRGFLIPALGVATGHLWIAVALAAAVFGVLHAYQNLAGAVRAALLGLVLTVPLLVTGSVVPSMLAHFLYDVVVGLWLADWLVRR